MSGYKERNLFYSYVITQNLRSKAEPGYGRRRVSSPPRRQPSPPPRRQPSPPTVIPQTRRQPPSNNTPRAINQSEPFSATLLVGMYFWLLLVDFTKIKGKSWISSHNK